MVMGKGDSGGLPRMVPSLGRKWGYISITEDGTRNEKYLSVLFFSTYFIGRGIIVVEHTG